MAFESKIKTIEWVDNVSRMIDQTILPYEFKTVDVKTSDEMYYAIKDMIVRGAPAIGIAGAHGVSLAAIELENIIDKKEFLEKLQQKAKEENAPEMRKKFDAMQNRPGAEQQALMNKYFINKRF